MWRDVRKDSLELFRQIFFHLEETGLLDMNNTVHRLCVFVVFQPRIQASLDRTRVSWNLHKLRTAGNKSPMAIFELSREYAMQRGYWSGDPGDDLATANSEFYGQDPDGPPPPEDELNADPQGRSSTEEPDLSESSQLRDAGVLLNDSDEIRWAKESLAEAIDVQRDDGNNGIDVYCEAVVYLAAVFAHATPP
jgi:hypothetical protein